MSTNAIDKREVLIKELLLRDLRNKAGTPQRRARAPITRADRTRNLPLSWAQQRLWFLDQLDRAASAAYHMSAGFQLRGSLNDTALQAALNRIVARHEILRTTFVATATGEPIQVIAPPDIGFTLGRQDLRGLPAAERQAVIDRVCAAECHRPFDLSTGPLIRGHLLQVADDHHVLLFTEHHIVSDGWSTNVLIDEIVALYTACNDGKEDPLPPLSLQYADYALWQRHWLQGQTLQTQLDFWHQHLTGAPTLLELPADRPRPSAQSYAGASVSIVLPAELTSALRTLSQRYSTTLFMTLFAGWSILLARLSGQHDLVIGTPVAGRQTAEIESLIGLFVNTLALRIHLDDDPTVAQLLERIKATTLAAQAHQDVPFEQVVEALQPARSLSYNPVFQVRFTWRNAPEAIELALPGLTLTPLPSAHTTSPLDLSLVLTDAGETIVGMLEYASALFEPATVERMAGHLQTLLAAMAADAGKRISALDLLAPHQRRQLLADWNATAAPYPIDRLVHQLFEAQAAAQPEATAVALATLETKERALDAVRPGEPMPLTYGELNRGANELAHYLVSLGVRPNDRVAICLERGFHMATSFLGILKAGGAYVPLDPGYPEERLAFMLADSAPTVLLTEEAVVERLPAMSMLRVVVLDSAQTRITLARQSSDNIDPATSGLTPEHLAYVIYTSGSSGKPKGVMVPHRSIANLARARIDLYDVRPDSRVLQLVSIGFDVCISEISMALCSGAGLYLAPPDVLRPDEPLLSVLQDYSITHVGIPVPVLAALPEGASLGAVQTLLTGGEPCPAAVARRWAGEYRFFNEYGPTETTVCATTYRCQPDQAGVVPIGRPIANTTIYLLDAHRQPVPIGVTGEIHIAGVQLASGYLNRPDLTTERFLPDPFSAAPDARMYKTGDLGRYLPDGNLVFVGRNDSQVKIRGFRIEPGEIEAHLNACRGIRDAAVIAREVAPGEQRLVAYLVLDEEVELSIGEVRAQLTSVLPEYMVPAAYVVLEAFPLTPNGKLDRHALPPPEADSHLRGAYEAPVGQVEAAVARIWQDLLHVEQVGRHDHFFELGGHSLLVVTFIERLRQLGLTTDVRSVFAAPTLAAIATVIAAAGSSAPRIVVPPNLIPADGDSVEAITPDMLPLVDLTRTQIDQIVATVPQGTRNVKDIYPLTPMQEGILFHHLLATDGDAYLLRSTLAFDTRARLDAFLHALQRIIDRHDILRTAFLWAGLPRPVQVVYRKAALAIRELTLDAHRDALEQLLTHTDRSRLRLDVQRAPLVAAHVAQDPRTGEWLLSLLNHHLMCDHTMLERVVAEIRAFLQGKWPDLPAPHPYRNFVSHALAAPADQHDAYFRAQLGDIDEPTAPFDVLNVQGDGNQVREVRLPLDSDLAQRIRTTARQYGTSAAVLFHVAYATVLARCSGRDDVVFGTVFLGRLQADGDLDRVLGMFINTLPLRIPLAGQTVLDAVTGAHERLSGLLVHERASLATAQRCSGVPAPSPLFTALLNYRHSNPGKGDNGANSGLDTEGVRLIATEERTNYPLMVSIDDLGKDFILNVQCIQAIDPARTAGYLRNAIESLVAALLRDPGQPVLSLPVLPETERRQLLVSWNATQAPRSDRLIHQLFEAQAATQPDAIAVVASASLSVATQLTYGELNRRANQLAHYLLSLGVRTEDRVALLVERSLDMVVGLLGILKAGAAYVPLDPGSPRERLTFMLEDCAPAALLTQTALEDTLPPLTLPIAALDDPTSFDQLPDSNPDPIALRLQPRHLAYLIYTSGSTGKPKGVMVEHASVVNFLSAMTRTLGIASHDSLLAVTTLSFDIAGLELYLPLANGARVVLASRTEAADPAFLQHSIDQLSITLMQATPATWRLLLNAGWQGAPRLQGLCGGEALPCELARKLVERVAALWNLYGPTETTIWATGRRVTADHTASVAIEPIGRPIDNTTIYLLDAHQQPVPIGVTGEIYIGGVQVARGYLNRPELTTERFLHDPFSSAPDARMYKSGDLGRYRPDGQIEFLGRNDFQVKLRGFRIELGEIEAALLTCRGVREAVVIAREDTPDDWSRGTGAAGAVTSPAGSGDVPSGDKRLVAYIVPEEQASLSLTDLRAQLISTLPEYMVPAAYVTLDTLPLTSNGKLDRKGLPAPESDAYLGREYEAPLGEIEAAIAAIWQELLHLQQVGRHDHFFELGGHSLLAVRLVSRLRQDLRADIALRDLFAAPTLCALADRVTNASALLLAPIRAADRTQNLPLSWAQQRLWFLDQLDPAASLAYHLPAALRMRGILDSEALQAALNRIVARHEILRTTFVKSVDGEPVQVIAPADCGFSLSRRDLRNLRNPQQQAAVARVTEEIFQRRFNLTRGPLIYGQLLQLADDEHILLICQHHIVSDAWSLGLIVQEIRALYSACIENRPDPLPALPTQYADYALWQRHWLQGEHLRTRIEFWRDCLAGAPALLELPTDHPRPAAQSFAGAGMPLVLSAELTAGLKALSQRHGTTLFMTLLSGWSTLLARLSGQNDVVVGSPVAGRQRTEIEPLVGFFVNTLALRIKLDDDPNVAQLLERVKAATLAAYAHQDLPFEQVVEALQPPRSLSYNPIFQVRFAWRNTPGETELTLPGLTLTPIPPPQTTSPLDLSLVLTDAGEVITGSLEFASALFERTTIERFAGHFKTLLASMVAYPEQRISRLAMLSPGQYRQLLVDWNSTEKSYPTDRLIHQLFEAHAAAQPEATAVVLERRPCLTYGELNRRANQLAHYLLSLGVRPDDRVAICVGRNLDMIVGLLGVLKAGGAYVPLDPDYPQERLAFMLTDCAPVALLTQTALAERLPAMSLLRVIVVDEAQTASTIAQRSTDNLDPSTLGLTPSHLAYLIYTSGSTGNPKGAMNVHRGIANLARTQIDLLDVRPDSRVLQFASFGFDASVWETVMALGSGACLCLASREALQPGEPLQATLQRNGITHVTLPPSVAATLSDETEVSPMTVVAAGEACPVAVARMWTDKHRFFNAYGPTETTVCATAYRCQPGEAGTLPIGRPIANTKIYLLDAHRQPVPIGVTGEIYIGGVQVARGYLNRPELTTERFLHDPFSSTPDARMYKSGDLGRYRPDGQIEFLGRNDFQVKLRGFRIELGEIEAALLTCRGVREAVVIAREDTAGNKRLVAYIVPEAQASLSLTDLRAQLISTLPEYMVPTAYVTLDALPLTSNGKLDRKRLPAPEGDACLRREYEAPLGEIETAIAAIWQELLHLQQVGRHDHFFELGGHSLLVITLIERLRRQGMTVDVRMVFTAPTLSALAAAIGASESNTAAVPRNLIPLKYAPTQADTETVVL